MYRLSLIVLLCLCISDITAQNPHGDDFKIDCTACHKAESWTIAIDTFNFNHDTMAFSLSGQHLLTNCIDCHTDFSFKNTPQDCISCHLDIHNLTVGNDCRRCHTSSNWLIDDIPELHEMNGFPLFGAHEGLSCVDCHISDTNLKFDRLGNECINCHLNDFENTTSPNHPEVGFSKNCTDCHNILSKEWNTDIVDHSFFPLTLGHDIQDCKQCHITSTFSDASPLCISCHQPDFDAAKTPDHLALNFDNDCLLCHTTEPGWMPAIFESHDVEHFPIYSGTHNGVWTSCIECHSDANDFPKFTCVGCHTNPETDDEHEDVMGYVYDDLACFSCHPTGEKDAVFNHDESNFPLTGAHLDVECLSCHSAGFEGTTTNCFNCHTIDFNGSTNPDHQELNLSNECINCHTTDPDWNPATFDVHDDFYPLKGAHVLIANDCVSCHNGDYNNTPNTCIGCHLEDYNNAEDPNHVQAQFNTDCLTCHTESAWMPATFDHDAQYFPIYSGKHEGEWTACIDCHTNPANFSEFQCTNCHTNPETDDKHDDVSGYIYNDNACLGCHPSGDADMVFDHNLTQFPLMGAHAEVDCAMCHVNGFAGTSSNCVDCHQMDFIAAINPNHQVLNLPSDCINCHTIEPNWEPANFEIHDDYYVLEGAHAAIALDCVACHNGDYNNTPNTCVGCHIEEYQQTTSPNHLQSQFNTDCFICHNENEWIPSTFDHDGMYFPIYSGKHEGEWSQCIDCHTNANDFTLVACINCHVNPETDIAHESVAGYTYSDNACLACHPAGDADMAFDHNLTQFPLTGAHNGLDCLLCHSNGYEGTPTNCVDCHQMDFIGSINPNHQVLNLPSDCINCHTTEPNWEPAGFDIHNDFYSLEGAHAAIALDCVTCHNGDYNNTPNTCVGCHLEDYNLTTSPNHTQVQFTTDCVACHSEVSWVPSSFDHDGQYFPINSGAHLGVWSECIECHNDPNNYSVFTCISCHINPETDISHDAVAGYIYNDNACFACHPTGESDMAFDHNLTQFPLTGAHDGLDCLLCHSNGYEGTPTNCVDCHQMDFIASINPNHQVLNLPSDCINCHTTEPNWEPAGFDIHNDFYALMGAHAAIATDCVTCHNGDYNNTPNTCVGCHLEEYNLTTNPNHTQVQFSTDCVACHAEDAWVPASFDHDGQYFPINSGSHMGVWTECIECHIDPNNYGVFTCVTCHSNPETDDDHTGIGGYIYESSACLVCHPNGEAEDAFDHNSTGFPLDGAHLGLLCLDCHENGFVGTPSDCFACHETDFESSLNPNHSNLGFPTNCIECHTTEPDWAPATFTIHDDYYELTGAHLEIGDNCIGCHNGDYNNTPNTCDGCHIPDYNSTTNPDHQSLNLPITCEDCHTTNSGWNPAMFMDHDDFYQLTGAHIDIADNCVLCHNGDYNNTPNTCDGCHIPDYNSTTNPDHQSLNLPITCEDCHTTDAGWMPATFIIHDDYYMLTGAHIDIADNCVICHNGDYANTPNSCDGCHLAQYNSTTNPNHQNLNIPVTCEDCHTTDPGWIPATFGIHDDYYELTGAHLDIADDCVVCHNGDYSNTPNTCNGCHSGDYSNTNNPDHNALNLPVTCDDCHTTDPDWMPATFDIHDIFYPLNGAHAMIADDCVVCHNGDYNNTPNTCVGCHQDAYNDANDPDHIENNISTDCVVCHNENAWVPSDFNHDDFWVLNGAHLVIANDCFTCHMGDYTNTPNECIGCHQADYDGTNNPDHAAAMFPTDCLACHSENAWTPSNFDHDGMYFPIYSGKHEDEWNLCIDCHIVPTDYSVFSCIDCHEHDDENEVDDDHDGVDGYVYLSSACYACHPTGEKD